MMSEVEYRKLVEDIRANGIVVNIKMICDESQPGVLQILDGRNRYKALKELGIDWIDDTIITHAEEMPDPIGYVLSTNLHRRHLNEGQLGLIAEKVANLRHGTNRHEEKVDVVMTTSTKPSSTTVSTAAAEVGVSRDTVQRARKLRATAVPDIVAADGRKRVDFVGTVLEN